MTVGAWIMLVLIGAGILGALVYSVVFVPESVRNNLPTRPVWMVLLAGGIDGRDRSDDPDTVPIGGVPHDSCTLRRGEEASR